MKTITKKANLIIILLCVVFLAAIPAASAEDRAVQISTLPLSFIENVGQKDPSVLFHADAAGNAIFFTADDVILARDDPESGTWSCIAISLAGSEPGVVKGIGQLSGKANFFVGSDPSEWYTGVPMYRGIMYEGALPGIDLVFKGDGGLLKREFALAPAVNPQSIVMKYRGHESLTLDDSGQLLVTSSTGVLTETAPFAYQEIHGRQVEVACRYVILGEDSVGFVLGEYNGAYPVIIDPYLEYSTYFGGYGNDIGYGIDVDDTGCAYITGSTDTTSMPLPPIGVMNETLNGGMDAFITKLSPDGTELEYFTYFGGSYDDVGTGIAVDSNYQAFITGYTDSADLPVLNAAYPTKSPCTDAFVAQIAANGSTLLGSTYFGGNETDKAFGIFLDSSEIPVITGGTNSDNLPVSGGCYQGALAGGTDAFVAQVTSALAFSTYLGGAQNDIGYAISLDSSDNIFVTGTTRSIIFPTRSGSFRRQLRGEQDAFITKLNPAASALVYSSYLGGYGYDGGRGIAVDRIGDAYVTGYTDSPSTPYTYTFPVWNAYQDTYGGAGTITSLHYGDAFVTKMNNAGSGLNYSTYLGGRGNDIGFDIAVDNLTRAHVTGWTNSPDFPTARALQEEIVSTEHGAPDAFVSQLSADGTLLDFSTYFGGTYYDEGYGIHSDLAGNVTITGYTQSPYYFPLMNPYQPELAGSPSIRNSDAFISRIARIIPVASFTADPDRGFVPLTVNFTDTSTGDPITWDWEFGDGGTSTEQNPTHTYNDVANYTVNLTVCNLDGCNSTSGIIYVGQNLIPDFTSNVTGGCKDLWVQFNDTSTGTPTTWSWEFGDGDGSTEQNATHTYTEAGIYNVTLSVTNFFGTNETTKYDHIMVNETPVADFTSNITIGFAPLTVQFEDNSTGYFNTYDWQFGDGKNSSSDQDPAHTFNDPGDYWVNLTVTNDCGSNWSNMTDYIRVGAPLVANFTANPTTGYMPFPVLFNDTSTGTPTTWSWDFGDGDSSTEQNATHTYTTSGVFDVSLNISNMYGFDLFTREDYITVTIRPDLYFVPDPVIIPTNDTTPMEIYLEIAEFGLSGYNMSVFFDDTGAANFTTVNFPSWALNQSFSTLPAPIINVKAADLDDEVTPGNTDILMLSFDTTGRNEMATTINISINKMSTDDGGDLVAYVIPGEVTVVRLLPIPGESLLPTDPDGDQLYWDLNGNGDIDFNDVVLYFHYMWWIELYEPIVLFDYNGNGNIDFNDLVLLYHEALA